MSFKDTQYNVSPFALFKTNWAIIKSADSVCMSVLGRGEPMRWKVL